MEEIVRREILIWMITRRIRFNPKRTIQEGKVSPLLLQTTQKPINNILSKQKRNPQKRNASITYIRGNLRNFGTTFPCKSPCAGLASASLICIPVDFNIALIVFEDGCGEISLTSAFAVRMRGTRPVPVADRSWSATRGEKRSNCRIRQLLEGEEAKFILAWSRDNGNTYTHPRHRRSLE